MSTLNRRSFINKSALGVLTAFALPLSLKSQADGKRLNIALCGLGRYSALLAESFSDTKYCRLAGLVTGTPSKAEEWGKKYAVPKANIYDYKNFDSIRNNKDIDLIYVVLPNAMHKEFVIRAALAGKHVIVEKPMGITAAEGVEMINACAAAKMQLGMGYRLHFEPYNLELKRLGQEKIFGQVRLVEASLGYHSGTPGEWRLKKALSGGGPLMNLGVYCVQACRYVLGEEPVSVTAQFGPVDRKELFSEVEETITWQLTFPSGAIGICTSSYGFGVDRVYASADDGYFELSPAISYGPFVGRTSKGPLNFPEVNQQAAQMDGISKAILDFRPLPDHINGSEGLKDMKVLDAIYKAAREGGRVIVSGS